MKKLLCILLSCLIFISSVAQICFADDGDTDTEFDPPTETGTITNGDFELKTYSDNTAVVTKYNGSDLTVTVPSEVNGYTVTGFAEMWAGSSFSAKNLYIPETIINICRDENSNLPTIYCCKALENIYVDENNPVYCSVNGVMFTKDMTKLVSYPSGNPRTDYTVPNGVTVIGEGSFWFSENLTSLILPDTLVKIEPDGVRGCKGLTQINLPSSLRILQENAFMACESLRSIDIPEGVTEIPYGCFWSCYALASVHLPSTVESIGNYAFAACYPLSHIEFPEGLLTMGGMCFALCSKLKSVTLPKSLKSVKSSVFTDSGVTTVYGYTGSVAEKLCNVKGYTFISIDPQFILGDINLDGTVNSVDYSMALSFVQCNYDLNDEEYSAADINGDGAVDAMDVIIIDLIMNSLY